MRITVILSLTAATSTIWMKQQALLLKISTMNGKVVGITLVQTGTP